MSEQEMPTIRFSKKAYANLADKDKLRPVVCNCKALDPDCRLCDGEGIVYESDLSREDYDKIVANLRRQGVPI